MTRHVAAPLHAHLAPPTEAHVHQQDFFRPLVSLQPQSACRQPHQHLQHHQPPRALQPTDNMTQKITLAYWDIRGLAQPIRLLLEYTGTNYEDKLYRCGEAPDYDKSCWFDEKAKLGLDFPNLPYLVDGDRKVVQSNAIIRYIARKHNLCGETEDEKVRVDILENQAMDFRNGFVILCYRDYNSKKDEYLKNLPGVLQSFSDYLGDRKWFAGDKITFVDFILYELLDQHKLFDCKSVCNFKNLSDFVDRFEALDKIKAYMKSSRYIRTPVNNKMAQWGGKKE